MVQDPSFPPPRPPYPMHECGVFGVFGHPNAAVLTYYGLFALQHRGQESAGIVTSNGPGSNFQVHRDMLPAEAGDTCEGRTAADNATVRTVFVIGPDKKIKLMLSYPMTSGRNFDEVLRVLDSIQLTSKHNVATPVNWRPGNDVIIPPSVSDEEAKKKFPKGWKTLKPYLRVVAQPE